MDWLTQSDLCSQAAQKGMPASVIGLVFSCFEFFVFASSPIYGNFVSTPSVVTDFSLDGDNPITVLGHSVYPGDVHSILQAPFSLLTS